MKIIPVFLFSQLLVVMRFRTSYSPDFQRNNLPKKESVLWQKKQTPFASLRAGGLILNDFNSDCSLNYFGLLNLQIRIIQVKAQGLSIFLLNLFANKNGLSLVLWYSGLVVLWLWAANVY